MDFCSGVFQLEYFYNGIRISFLSKRQQNSMKLLAIHIYE